MFPACAGMIPSCCALLISFMGVPRMRGDDPGEIGVGSDISTCSPHARG